MLLHRVTSHPEYTPITTHPHGMIPKQQETAIVLSTVMAKQHYRNGPIPIKLYQVHFTEVGFALAMLYYRM